MDPQTEGLASDGPPLWDELQEIHCPLCDYNLRGLSEPRCPECGYRFVWADLTDPARRLHPYIFEHHPERNIWSFWKTAFGGLLPSRFWKSLRPEQPSSGKRLFLYWAWSMAVVVFSCAIQYVHAAVGYQRMVVVVRATLQVNPTPPGWSYWKDQIIAQHGSFQAALDAYHPLFPSPRFLAAVLRDRSVGGVVIPPVLVSLVWPWLTFMALMLFRWSMRKARIKPVHVLRCVLYSFDLGLWVGGVISVATLSTFLVTKTASLNQYVRTGIVWFCLFMALLAIRRLRIAYRVYLCFDHAFMTVLSSQVIVFLIVLLVAL